MEQNTDRMGFALIALSVVAVVLLIMNTFFGPTVKGFFSGYQSWESNVMSTISGRQDPNNSKWVQKGNWGSNGKFVVDKDGNAVIYAIDASKPIVFHNMSDENAKLPTASLTTLTFQDKVQGDIDSSMAMTFNYSFPNLKTIHNMDTNVDTSNVTDMSNMFWGSKLTSVGNLSKWNISNVTNMNGMFRDSKLTFVGDLSQWNTSKVIGMNWMFSYSQLTPPAWYHE